MIGATLWRMRDWFAGKDQLLLERVVVGARPMAGKRVAVCRKALYTVPLPVALGARHPCDAVGE